MKKIIILIIMLNAEMNLAAQNTGIGTTTPSFKLDVKNGSINTDSVYRIGGNTVVSTKGTQNTFLGVIAGAANSSGSYNVAGGYGTLTSNSTGNYNAAFGHQALFFNNASNNTAFGTSALFANTSGNYNTALGVNALYYNTTATHNTAVGGHALYLNLTGIENTAVGESALFSNTTGQGNTAQGRWALYSNTTGEYNTAIGHAALRTNTIGRYNTAIGWDALRGNISSDGNTAIGYFALRSNPAGEHNTAVGGWVLGSNYGSYNTAFGYWAHRGNLTGNKNTAIGNGALLYTTASDYNVAVGFYAGGSVMRNFGWNNTLIGSETDATGNGFFNSIALGNIATINGSNQTRIGNSFTVSTGGYTGWTNISDGRYKKNVQEDVKGLDFILRLRPVTYHLDVTKLSEKLNEKRGRELTAQSKMAIIEKERQLLSGFVAQEVEQAANSLGYDFSGVDRPADSNDFYGLRYAEFVVPLVKAVQEQQQLINEMKKEIDLLKEQNKLLLRLLKNKN